MVDVSVISWRILKHKVCEAVAKPPVFRGTLSLYARVPLEFKMKIGNIKDLGRKCFGFTKMDAGEIAVIKARI